MKPSRWLSVAALAGTLLVSGTAWAGEILIGVEPLEVDDAGNLIKDARGKAVKEIESSVPGDEIWTLFLWAKLDNPAVGPMYLEFYRDYQGKELMAHRIEIPEFEGGKYLSMDVEISRQEGFKTGETVDIAFVQSVGGRDVKKAKGKVKLLASSKPAPKPEEGESDEEDEVDPNEAKEIAETPAGDGEGGPPAVEGGDKKGCTVGGVAPSPWLLLGLLAVPRSRRRARG